MTAITLTSELDAVNLMLDVIGEAPVNTLETTKMTDVAKAKAALSELSRTVQSRGWHFNTEREYPLAADVDGNVNLPSNTLRFDVNYRSASLDLTQRGARLYDRENHTYNIGETVYVDIVFLLPWTDLPETARKYIAIRAARTFQKRQLGDEKADVFTAEDEQEAKLAFLHAEDDSDDSSLLDGSGVFRVLDRGANAGIPYETLYATLK